MYAHNMQHKQHRIIENDSPGFGYKQGYIYSPGSRDTMEMWSWRQQTENTQPKHLFEA